jgi:predicted HTH transcriptional regulator
LFDNSDSLLQFLKANIRNESRSIEYKSPVNWKTNKEFKVKIVKSVLAFSNIQDGGYIIIGVEEDNTKSYEIVGLDKTDSDTYTYDEIIEFTNSYADPFVKIDMGKFPFEERIIIVIQVYESDELPVICKKDYQGILERGRIYARTYKKPESTYKLTTTETREIIDIAVKKQLKKFYDRLSYIGLNSQERLITEMDNSNYEKERNGF